MQEKKISAKINYDVLKSLNAIGVSTGSSGVLQEIKDVCDEKILVQSGNEDREESANSKTSAKARIPNETAPQPTSEKNQTDAMPESIQSTEESINAASEEELEDDYDEEPPVEEPSTEMGVLQMLRQHREGADDENEDFEYNYYEEPEDY
nr:unnamed protein product [Callosobruchus analis]